MQIMGNIYNVTIYKRVAIQAKKNKTTTEDANELDEDDENGSADLLACLVTVRSTLDASGTDLETERDAIGRTGVADGGASLVAVAVGVKVGVNDCAKAVGVEVCDGSAIGVGD